MAKRKAKSLKAGFALGLCAAMIASVSVGTTSVRAGANAFGGVSSDGKYYTDFNTLQEAQDAAADIAQQIAGEGDTLLKNKNNALPMKGTEKVSVFGVAQDALAGNTATDTKLLDALQDEGFKVNKSLRSYYESVGTTFGAEETEFVKGVENSYGVYNDAAIIVLSRGGGEGSDMSTVTDEEADEQDLAQHSGYVAQADGKTYKHFLQLTDSEEELFEYVKAQGFKKIVYLINSSEIMELGNLEKDEDVDAILWIGRPGKVGTISAAGILSGRINPSGKTVDTWYTDFTADPIWQNSIANQQNGGSIMYDTKTGENRDEDDSTASGGFAGSTNHYYGVDYEEGIYVGYRYYETKAADMGEDGEAWYQGAVTYPFGYGLSYTEYEYSGMKVTANNADFGGAVDAATLSSSVGKEAEVKELKVSVDVTNTGKVAGKESVEIYVKAPYISGEVEKPHVKLVGFGKTEILEPGETQTVEITVNVQDMASYDATDANENGTKGYELDAGAYTLMAMANAHGWADTTAATYQDVDFTLSEDAYLQLDDFSGNEIKNLFSKENGMFYSLRDNTGKYQFNQDENANETQLSRANFEETFPVAPTEADLTMTENMYKSLKYWDSFNVDDAENYADGKVIEGVVDEDDYPWMAETEANAEKMKNWTQTGTYGIQLSEMSGIDPYGVEVIEGGKFDGKTGEQAWDEFMNTLTYQDEMDLAGQLQKKSMDSIGMNALAGQDSAWNYASTFNFTCNTILGATWNTELARQKGTLIGNMALLSGNNTWWGNSANTHRSPFGGRVFEYPSEDGILAGYISGNETLGATSRGLCTYMKHCALNDQETKRNGLNLFAWVSEQAMREIYYKSFQICAQEGQSTGLMGAFARAGRVSINVNYNFCTELFRNEWGCKTMSITTDNYNGMKNCSPLDLLVRAGTDNIATSTMSGSWDSEKNAVVLADSSSTVSANQWYTTRKCAMIFLWTHANTAMNKNGVSFSGWEVKSLAATQASAAEALDVKAAGVEAEKVEYAVTAGALPDGLVLNADGSITGTPIAKAGTYNFTVQCRADNWITSTKNYTITISSAFEIDETQATAGEEFYAVIESDTVNNKTYTLGVTYSVKEGKLPAGLALSDDGVIEGTPTESGEFNLTIGVEAKKSVRSGYSSTTVIDNYEYDVTISVTAGETVVDHGGIVNIVKTSSDGLVDTYTVTYADGSTFAYTVTNGADGLDGADGETPTVTISEDGYWVINGTKTDVKAVGEDGEKGDTGEQGPAGADGKDAEGGCGSELTLAGVTSIAILGSLVAAAFIAFRKREN